VTRQESIEDLEQRLIIRERYIGDPEVPLITRVDIEGTSRRVHRSKVLSISDFLKRQLTNIIPMLHILCLT
jgi:hypothetical protein